MDIKEFIEQECTNYNVSSPVGTIVVPAKRSLYIALHKRFVAMANLASESFGEAYINYENYEDLLKNAYPDFQKSIAIVLEDIKSTFVSMECYDTDYDTIYKMALNNNLLQPFDSAYDSFESKVEQINSDLQDEKDYREYRKDSRGTWEGGTIGGNALTAINNQVKLDAMNAAGGVAHDLFNAAGNFFSEMQAESELEDLFKNKSTFKSFMKGVYNTVIKLENIYTYDETLSELFDLIDKDNIQKAKRLMNNLESGSIPENKIEDIVKQVVDLDPYNHNLYIYLLNKFGDDGDLSILALYFGMEDLVNNQKEYNAKQYLDEIIGETEEDAQNAVALLEEYCKKINLQTTDESLWKVDLKEILEDFDLQYRTVEGVEHETRDAADFSKKELVEIQEFMEDIKPLDGEPLLPYENNLLAKKEEFQNKFSSEISKVYLEKIDKNLKDFNKAFLNVGFLGSTNREAAAKIRAMKYAKGLKMSTMEEYENQYQKFCDFIPTNLGITIEQADQAKAVFEKKKNKIENGGSSLFKGLFSKR